MHAQFRDSCFRVPQGIVVSVICIKDFSTNILNLGEELGTSECVGFRSELSCILLALLNQALLNGSPIRRRGSVRNLWQQRNLGVNITNLTGAFAQGSQFVECRSLFL